MIFSVGDAIPLLERTPVVLSAWLRGLPDAWVHATEGEETWSPHDIVGHLVHGEKTDWIARMERILSADAHVPFEPFDRFAFQRDDDSLDQRLDAFARLRAGNVETLRARGLTSADLARTGVHPEFGSVTLGQLLATWVVHDQSHVAQIARVMARRYGEDVGPWRAFIPLVGQR